MNLTEMYMASPDWLKLAWIALPCATIYGVARIWGRVRIRALPEPRVRDVDWVEVKRVEGGVSGGL